MLERIASKLRRMFEMQAVDENLLSDLVKDTMRVGLEDLKSKGWRMLPPNHLPIPQSHDEARAMILLGERYLKDHPS